MSSPTSPTADLSTSGCSFRTGDVTAIAGAHWIHDTYTALLPPLLPALMERLAFSTALGGF
ncbi:MAG: hypothetical protein ACLFU8_13965 [Anaerolineales bacterium]